VHVGGGGSRWSCGDSASLAPRSSTENRILS
jgi:hypothetical protein